LNEKVQKLSYYFVVKGVVIVYGATMKFPIFIYAALLVSASPVFSQTFTDLWYLGVENGNQSDFEQEVALNQDYYFENGDYTGLFPPGQNWTAGMEPLTDGIGGNAIGFPRAVTSGVTMNHIYFQLSGSEADAAAVFRYKTKAQAPAEGSTNDLSFKVNGTEVHAEPGVGPTVPLDIEFTFTGAGAFTTPGSNVFTIERTGGAANPAGSAWIQFDYHQLSIDLESIGCLIPICSFSADTTTVNPGGAANLSWLIANTATAMIDNGVGDVAPITTNGIGSASVSPTQNTTYTLDSTAGGNSDSQTVTVNVVNIVNFNVDFTTIFSGEPVLLTWNVDPSASVSIAADNGLSPGNVDASTVNGAGDITVNPSGVTTFTLTSTRGADVETAQVTVTQIGIASFTSDDVEIFPGESAPTLSWTADPAATLTLSADDGSAPINVDANTTGGFGSIVVNPTEDATVYTLTADVGGTIYTAAVTVEVNGYDILWQIGDDNDNNDELEQEKSFLRDFYVDSGDYTGLTPAGQLWTSGPELWQNGDANDEIGMPRALTTGFLDIDMYFQLSAEYTTPGTVFRFGMDIQNVRTIAGLPSSHDVAILVNDTLAYEVTGNTTEPIRGTFTSNQVGAQTGSNVITIRRTGGDIPAWPAGTSNPNASWIVFDYFRLEAISAPAPDFRITDISLDPNTLEITITWKSIVGFTYQVEVSSNLVDWQPLVTGQPVGGATSGSSVFVDDDAFLGDDERFYRIRLE
jgi:hypothetical protein